MATVDCSLEARAPEIEVDLSTEQIDDVVSQLNGICRTSSLEFALHVGAVIIHHFYGGDTEAWRTRGPKVNSFRRLAEHPELALSAGALYRCVAVFEMCDRLRAPSRWRRLSASHLRAVIGVPAEKQEYLLGRANDERWSVQALQMKAQGFRSTRERGGRRRESSLSKHLRALDRSIQNFVSALGGPDDHDPTELAESVARLEGLKKSMIELTHAVELKHSQLEDTR